MSHTQKERTGAPQAILWDLDGTLIDSQHYWCEAEFDVARRHRAPWSTEDSLALIGLGLLDAGQYIRKRMAIDLSPEQIVEELLDGVVARIEDLVPWRAGALELLSATRAAGLRCALVTMSYRRFTDPVLAALPPGTFAAVVTGDAVAHGKPHPDPYLEAAAALGVDPRDCVAIEDSKTGLRSAVAAGCRVVAAPSHGTVSADDAHLVVDGLTELAVADLVALMATPLAAREPMS